MIVAVPIRSPVSQDIPDPDPTSKVTTLTFSPLARVHLLGLGLGRVSHDRGNPLSDCKGARGNTSSLQCMIEDLKFLFIFANSDPLSDCEDDKKVSLSD